MICWNIKDRKSGQSIIVPGPTTPGEADTLRTILKNCAAMGNIRHGDGVHKHPSVKAMPPLMAPALEPKARGTTVPLGEVVIYV
jgi:hypothetical protein